METRKLALLLITVLNSAVEQIEEAVSEEGDEKEEKSAKPKAGGRAKPETVKATSTKKHGSKSKDEDEENEEEEAGDEPSEDDVVDAVRGAQKVLESADIKKILKKHGKADRASEVEPENRQAVIDALEKAVEDAE